MKNSNELLQLGKRLAADYIEKGADLTKSLTKLANDHTLSKEEISRIAEQANIETYLGLVNKTPDHYVQFALADPKQSFEKAAELRTPDAVEIVSGDEYVDINSSDNFSLSQYKTKSSGTEVITKEASSLEPWFRSVSWKNNLDFIKEEMFVKKAELSILTDEVMSMTKQAVLCGVTFNNIVDMIKIATPSLANYITAEFKDNFNKECPFIDLEKTADVTLVPSKNSDLFQKLALLDSKYADFTNSLNTLETGYAELNAFIQEENLSNLVKVAGVIKELTDFAKRHPVVGIGVPAFIAGVISGKRSEKPSTNYLNRTNAQQAILNK